LGKEGRRRLVSAGAWSVPKSLVNSGEDELAAAWREFKEETGFDIVRSGIERDLGIFPQSSGKRLHIWAIDGDCNPPELTSNLFAMEWPPRSGRTAQFPEVDRGAWFDRGQAMLKIVKGQRPILEKFLCRIRLRMTKAGRSSLSAKRPFSRVVPAVSTVHGKGHRSSS
jgi:predicted NUDIX family NTP pyrophosphohydrolase